VISAASETHAWLYARSGLSYASAKFIWHITPSEILCRPGSMRIYERRTTWRSIGHRDEVQCDEGVGHSFGGATVVNSGVSDEHHTCFDFGCVIKFVIF
jgi:hypothetical protein